MAMADLLAAGHSGAVDARLDQSSHLIYDSYRNPDPGDHHLDVRKTADVWAVICNAFVPKQS